MVSQMNTTDDIDLYDTYMDQKLNDIFSVYLLLLDKKKSAWFFLLVQHYALVLIYTSWTPTQCTNQQYAK